ncbi:MAG: winged helix-turn-helix domain-containing protein [Deltaproteobacteria bacterium]|nr:winged helix-turn-helix domain-containing protein [Kofleriaceae bacterium]
MRIGAKFTTAQMRGLGRRSRPPAPPNRGEVFRAMLDADAKLTRAELARRLGISRAAVTQALRR